MKWTHKKLSQVATILMGQSPPGSTYNETGQGLPFFQGVKDFGARYPSERVYCTAPTSIAEEGDILFSVRAPIGSINRANQKCAIGRGLSAIRASTPSDTAFLEFLLRSMNRAWGRYESQGAIFGNARKRDLEDLDVLWPPDDVRGRITSTLSAYDDLIENNRRRIQLLEQAARLLYKEWFVHLRFPGHEHAKIKDGVPEGWEKTTIGAASSFLSRGITPKYDNEASGLVINQKCIRHHMINIDLSRRQSKEPPVQKLVRFGDVLINSTGAGTLGRVAQYLFDLENCTVDSHVTIVRPAEYLPVHFFGVHLANMESYIATLGRGATNQTELSRDSIAALPILVPSNAIGTMYEDVVSNLFRQIRILTEQIRNLRKARDLLLPRLMNGEVVV